MPAMAGDSGMPRPPPLPCRDEETEAEGAVLSGRPGLPLPRAPLSFTPSTGPSHQGKLVTVNSGGPRRGWYSSEQRTPLEVAPGSSQPQAVYVCPTSPAVRALDAQALSTKQV